MSWALQQAWDSVSTLPPIAFSETEEALLLIALSSLHPSAESNGWQRGMAEVIARWDEGEGVLRRIAARVVVTGRGCWECSYAKDSSGYPQISVSARMQLVHRLTYTAAKGEIPFGLRIDHLCRNRACCNPAHLEAVTSRENTLRGDTIPARHAAATHCPQGHARSPENTFPSDSKPGRQKRCRTCHNIRNRARKERQRSAA